MVDFNGLLIHVSLLQGMMRTMKLLLELFQSLVEL